jgi:hypothetical protein
MRKRRTRLACWLDSPEAPTVAEFARRVGADRQRIYRCAKGERRPGLDLAIAIERESGGKVPISSWSGEKPWTGRVVSTPCSCTA